MEDLEDGSSDGRPSYMVASSLGPSGAAGASTARGEPTSTERLESGRSASWT